MMDPPPPPYLINDASFPSANTSSYSSSSLTEIWPFSRGGSGVVVGVSEPGDGDVLGLLPRLNHFEHNLAGFVNETTTGNGTVNRGDMSVDESTVTEQSGRSRGGGGGARTRRKQRRDAAPASENEFVSTSSGNDMNDSDGKRQKVSESGDENGNSKVDMEANLGSGNNKQAEQSTQPTEWPKQDYIHVRARRGQATDSHSLAERARREKISERMKILQELVPGCNKVIGKALVLDEIINYIQSLQRQVEFLSMKLEAVNSRISPSIEGFPPKDFGEQTFDTTGLAFNSQAAREYGQGSAQEWLHMQVGSSFERAT